MGLNSCPVYHTDVTRAQMKNDEDAVNAIVGWLEEVNPFDATTSLSPNERLAAAANSITGCLGV